MYYYHYKNTNCCTNGKQKQLKRINHDEIRFVRSIDDNNKQTKNKQQLFGGSKINFAQCENLIRRSMYKLSHHDPLECAQNCFHFISNRTNTMSTQFTSSSSSFLHCQFRSRWMAIVLQINK